MRVQPVTNCEKAVILEALKIGKRFDFRSLEEFRDVKLVVGAEVGTAICTIGNTKVMAAVSAEIAEPSSMRPHKGVINIDVDLSPMANYANEHDRLGSKGMELIRLLELIIRDSRCIDVEALCIRAGKEIWKIRVDVRILDEDGSLLDCACLAAITALQHFRRPNVTLEPHHTLIYSEYEKAPVPLNIYHMPICTTIGLLDKGQIVVIDPTDKETACLDGSIVVACNKRREVCALHQSTNLILSTKQIERCVKLAMARAEALTAVVSDVIKQDQIERSAFKRPDGFAITTPSLILTAGTTASRQIRAPVIKTEPESFTQRSLYQPSVILNENPLSVGSVKQEDVDEETLLAEQLTTIQNSVGQVEVTEKQTVAVSSRKREVEEVNDLLDGLDDDDEEEEVQTMTLGSETVLNDVPMEEAPDAEDSLVNAKKKKKK
ncbi:Exosome complex component RRP45 [Caenorhabditis elegans]|uniref:Exosome complex component RRP45 n=1 Tax=Caenorhabditis elegans TaxID=6239 RepID=Q20128_CAEEL|nr:Exosome complex component RRP45 [Caenorhabditis elegans]CCD70741.1 Exosome complex component RRP45 [Caenorhabditis elegans]|eukprot:NP_741217.1 EXOSome (multiexonuclease complex) component [Caenorhabditis elegans]